MISRSEEVTLDVPPERCNRQYRILVVDDDSNFRNGVRRMLHLLGRTGMHIQFSEADGAMDAFRQVEADPPDCVLLDFEMPGLDGLAALSRIHSLNENLAVIMVTGRGDEGVAVSALKWGACDYLVKGAISPALLRMSISNACERMDMKRAIQRQREQLIEAERQRVLIQSLGAACHHLGQPATVLMCYLEILKKQAADNEQMKDAVEKCIESAELMAKLLQQLQEVSVYRTVPYLTSSEHGSPRSDSEILDISEHFDELPARQNGEPAVSY